MILYVFVILWLCGMLLDFWNIVGKNLFLLVKAGELPKVSGRLGPLRPTGS